MNHLISLILDVIEPSISDPIISNPNITNQLNISGGTIIIIVVSGFFIIGIVLSIILTHLFKKKK